MTDADKLLAIAHERRLTVTIEVDDLWTTIEARGREMEPIMVRNNTWDALDEMVRALEVPR